MAVTAVNYRSFSASLWILKQESTPSSTVSQNKNFQQGPLFWGPPKKIAEMPRKFNIQQISLLQIILTPCDGGALEIGRLAKLVDPRPPQNQPTRLWLSTLPLMAEIWRENQLIMCLLSIYDGFYTSQGVVWDFFHQQYHPGWDVLFVAGFWDVLFVADS